jgi:hypothetical protein
MMIVVNAELAKSKQHQPKISRRVTSDVCGELMPEGRLSRSSTQANSGCPTTHAG